MIQRNSDLSLSYIDQQGKLISATWQNYGLYSAMNAIFEKQTATAQQDQRDVNDYLYKVGVYNQTVLHPDLNPGAPPLKPQRTVIDDATGMIVAHVDYGPYKNGEGTEFSGPLPDVNKPTPAHNPVDNKIAVVLNTIPTDKALELLLTLTTRIAADVAEIKGKVAGK